jgi:ubiquitin C-terminal hydrolase
MSKSSKKRRQAAERQKELEKLRGVSLTDVRGVSLLDEGSPAQPLHPSPNPLSAAIQQQNRDHNDGPIRQRRQSQGQSQSQEDAGNKKQDPVPFLSDAGNKKQDPVPFLSGVDSLSSKRKQIEFVLPRAQGKAQQYVFDKARAQRKDDLSVIQEEETPGETAADIRAKKNESLEEILFPKKRRKLADKFEAVHRAEETKKEQKSQLSPPKEEAPPAPLKVKKKKRLRSSSLDRTGEEKKELSDAKEVKSPKTTTPESGQPKASPAAQSRDPNKAVAAASNGTARLNLDMVNQQWSGRSVEEAVKDKHGLRPRANSTDGELNLPQRGLCDEQMVLRSHQWHDQYKHAHHVSPRGFTNLGNTCFLNSILQCLGYLPPLCQSLIAISDMKKKQPKNNGMKAKLNQGQRITLSLCNFFHKVHGFPGSSTHDGSIAPQAIVKALPSLGSIGNRNGYKFWPGRQEDAHEFLVHLLDAMHNGELRAAGINQHSSGWRDRLPVNRLDETTFIHRIFGGYFRSQVRCKACGYCSNTYDPFLDLSLEVSKKSSNSIMQSISEFTKRETLDSDNQWKCSGCKKYVCPTKQLTVFRPPLSLCIQLKRFTFDGGFSSFGGGGSWKYGKVKGGGRSKIAKPIEFPADLNLPLSDGRSCAYNLTGVVIHVGGSASSGHYTAYVKKPSRNGRAQWYHADDSFVEPVSEKTVLRQKDAYILFYSRKEVKLEFPSPPPRDMSAEEAREFGRARSRARADSNTGQEEIKPKESQNSTKDGVVQRTKATIHPLAEFLNTTMTEQFKTAMSPEPTKLEKRSPVEESQKRKEVRKSPAEALFARTGTPGSKGAEGPAAKPKAGESCSESSSSEESSADEVGGRTELAAPQKGRTSADAKSPPVGEESSGSDSSESEAEDDPTLEASNVTGKSSSSSSSSKSESSESETEVNQKLNAAKVTGKSASSSSSESESSSENEEEIVPKSETRSSPTTSIEGQSAIERSATDESSSGSDSPNAVKEVESEKQSMGASSKAESTLKPAVKQTPVEESSSESDSSDSESETESNKVNAQSTPPSATNSEKPNAEGGSGNRTRVVVGSADSRGRVKVMMGPRKRKAWVAKTTATAQKGAAFQLLGNQFVCRWDEDDDKTADSQPSQMSKSTAERDQIVQSLEKKANARKRKMHLDRWDSLLDQGKVSSGGKEAI